MDEDFVGFGRTGFGSTGFGSTGFGRKPETG